MMYFYLLLYSNARFASCIPFQYQFALIIRSCLLWSVHVLLRRDTRLRLGDVVGGQLLGDGCGMKRLGQGLEGPVRLSRVLGADSADSKRRLVVSLLYAGRVLL
jgi:hypothetical protein